MSLDMFGTIDDTFQSVPATRTPQTTAYVLGLPEVVEGTPALHKITLQPLSPKDLQSLPEGGDRLEDLRKIYVNDGDLYSILPSDQWAFLGVPGAFKTIKLDNRPWRNYCKIIVSVRDDTQ